MFVKKLVYESRSHRMKCFQIVAPHDRLSVTSHKQLHCVTVLQKGRFQTCDS